MIGPIVYLSDPSETSTSQMAPVGTIRSYLHTTYGYQQYRAVKCAEAGVSAGIAVVWKSGSTTGEVELPAAANAEVNKIAGIAQQAIANASYGWVLCSGEGQAMAGEAVTIDNLMFTTGTIGHVDDAATASAIENAAFGTFITGTSSPDELVRVRVSGLL